MRIGIDATALPPRLTGAGNYIVNLVRALVDVDAANDYVVFVKPPHVSLFETRGRLYVIRAALASRVLRIAWEQTLLPMIAREQRLDVLHSPHYTMPLALGCKSVVTFHDLTFFLYPQMHKAYKRIFFRTMIRLAARRADAIIADSESTRQDAIHILHLKPDRITTVPLGVSADFKPIKDAAAIDQIQSRYQLPGRFILCVGELQPRKNLPNLIRAFGMLVQRGLTHSLVIAGKKGWMYDELHEVVEELGLANRVLFTGYVPEDDLPLLYNATDLVVYPSIYEGFGLPVLEAMACGAPVITSNISSMPEIVGSAGILVNPYSVDELANAMWLVLTDQTLRGKLARDEQMRARMFSWERTARETLAIYEHAVQTR